MGADYKQPSFVATEPTGPARLARRGRPAKFWWALGLGGLQFAYGIWRYGFSVKEVLAGLAAGLMVFAVVGLTLTVLDWVRHRVV